MFRSRIPEINLKLSSKNKTENKSKNNSKIEVFNNNSKYKKENKRFQK